MKAYSMTLSLKQVTQRGKFVWLTLRTEQETRECCYQRYSSRKYFWADGDNEPEMAPSLSRIWESDGDRYIRECVKTGEIQTISAPHNQ